MLVPAICYKEEIEKALGRYFYSKDMMYYMGCNYNSLINVSDNSDDGITQYAVINKEQKLIGYISFFTDLYSSSVYRFGAFSFNRGNPIMGKDLFNLLENLVSKFHRVEFKAVSGNPAIKGYDKFLELHLDIGKKIVFTDVFKDNDGNYHDTYTYEFVRRNNNANSENKMIK